MFEKQINKIIVSLIIILKHWQKNNIKTFIFLNNSFRKKSAERVLNFIEPVMSLSFSQCKIDDLLR